MTFLVLFALLSTATLIQAAALRTATGDSRAALELYHVVAQVQKERRLAVEHVSSPSEASLQALREQGEATDGAVREFTDHRARFQDGDDSVSTVAHEFADEVERREALRSDAMSEEPGVEETMSGYSGIVDRGIRLYDAIGDRFDYGRAVAASAGAVETMRAQDLFSRAAALLGGRVAADEFSVRDQVRFSSRMSGFRDRLRETGPALEGPPAEVYAELTEGDSWNEVNAVADRIIERSPETAPGGGEASERDGAALPAGADDWNPDAAEVHTGLTTLVNAQARSVVSAVETASTWMFTLALGGGIMALFAGTMAHGVASKSASRLTNKLVQLRADTLRLAREELPRIVGRLERGEPVDLDTEMRQLDHGVDEVGQVADAFNVAQRTAVSAAVKQSELRAGVNRVFLSIAHRNQSLVQRQLHVLDRVEREEEDPDLLEDLFHLDHLATRGRRNAENLIILGGEQPGRRWRTPIPLVDVLRGAISETEEYARVKLRAVPELALSGKVVADVIHLVAELVENATAFSPPHTQVYISSETVPKGLVVEIEDRGLGMGQEALDQANQTLSQAPEFDVMALTPDSRLGLFVVARLAEKHGIHVQLRPSPYGGTRAVVLVPSALVSSTQPAMSGVNRTEPGVSSETRDCGDRIAAQTRHQGEAEDRSRPEPSAEGNVRQVALEPRQHPDAGSPSERAPEGTGVSSLRNTDTEERSAAPGEGSASAPVEPVGGGRRPELPRRRRQANIASQLRQETDAECESGASTEGPAERKNRSPDESRRMMYAFQTGTRRGREAELAEEDRGVLTAPDESTEPGAGDGTYEPVFEPAAPSARDGGTHGGQAGVVPGEHMGESE
ncbi:sensor histidine kinase [Haloactinospora alba]|uniref:sensor histidine kinase n=1 Tax=Haloactinospora alba TaxID=405555 RepID=UPI001FEC8628|nr:sensor histidine kinase [Haloactinospora alba]